MLALRAYGQDFTPAGVEGPFGSPVGPENPPYFDVDDEDEPQSRYATPTGEGDLVPYEGSGIRCLWNKIHIPRLPPSPPFYHNLGLKGEPKIIKILGWTGMGRKGVGMRIPPKVCGSSGKMTLQNCCSKIKQIGNNELKIPQFLGNLKPPCKLKPHPRPTRIWGGHSLTTQTTKPPRDGVIETSRGRTWTETWPIFGKFFLKFAPNWMAFTNAQMFCKKPPRKFIPGFKIWGIWSTIWERTTSNKFSVWTANQMRDKNG